MKTPTIKKMTLKQAKKDGRTMAKYIGDGFYKVFPSEPPGKFEFKPGLPDAIYVVKSHRAALEAAGFNIC